MKKIRILWISTVILVIVLSSFTLNFKAADKNPEGNEKMRMAEGRKVNLSEARGIKAFDGFMEREITKGNLKLANKQVENLGGYVHERYDCYYNGVKVWGAQLVRHLKDGRVYYINGSYHDDINIPVIPSISIDEAIDLAKISLTSPEYVMTGEPELVIFPSQSGYLLSYKVTHVKVDSMIDSFVNAMTGEFIFNYENVKTQAAIGIGTGTHNDQKKLSTYLQNDTYYAIDVMRPATITTLNMQGGTDIWTGYYCVDADNTWDDKTMVDAHAYMGWTYDYFKLVHDRNGINDNDMDHYVMIHFYINYENAFYNPSSKAIYFGDGDPRYSYPYCAALDILAHEFTHGVTDHSSALVYMFMPGALSEAFSDIMGVSCEIWHQPGGYGYLKADWWEGEDINKTFGPSRDLSDPRSIIWYPAYGWFYPDHMYWYYNFSYGFDNGGVHINMTIPSHWYYLLAHGGTNRTSGISVSGIGVGSAERIAYRAWVYYLTPTSDFWDCRSATYQAAVDLFGSGSTEAQRVAVAWDAVGVY